MQDTKGKAKRGKIKIVGVYQEPHWPKHETLTQAKHKGSSLIDQKKITGLKDNTNYEFAGMNAKQSQ